MTSLEALAARAVSSYVVVCTQNYCAARRLWTSGTTIFPQAILKKIGQRTGSKPNYLDDEESSEDERREDSSGDDEGLLDSYARRRGDGEAKPSHDLDPSLALLCGQ